MLKTFDVYSGMIRVSDPVYTSSIAFDANGDIASILTLKAKSGRWVAEVEKDEKVYQDAIEKLIVYYDEEQSKLGGINDLSGDFNKALAMMMAKDPELLLENKTFVTVESGQVGIFDNKSYRDNKTAKRATRISDKVVCEDEPWYSICCDRVLSEDQWGVVPNGCVTTSKQGRIEIITYSNATGEVVKIEINFNSAVVEDREEEDDSYDSYIESYLDSYEDAE